MVGGSLRVLRLLPSLKLVTDTAWVHDRLCKLQKGCTRLTAASHKVTIPVAWSVVLSGYSGFFQNIAESGVKHNKSNQIKSIAELC